MSSSAGPTPPYTALAISRPVESITHVELHRPEKRNAMNKDFWRQEVDIAAEDVGTLQRLPKVIGSRSLVNELALTVRKMFADEAKSCGLVSRVVADKEAMMAELHGHMEHEHASSDSRRNEISSGDNGEEE